MSTNNDEKPENLGDDDDEENEKRPSTAVKEFDPMTLWTLQ